MLGGGWDKLEEVVMEGVFRCLMESGGSREFGAVTRT